MTTNSDPLPSLRSILVPTDFSVYSARALDHALEIASGYDAQIQLFHCIDPTPYNLGAPDAVQMACDAAWRDLRQLDSDLRGRGLAKNIEIELLVEAGDLATILPQITLDLAVGLIVVGTHGRTGWRKAMLGSVAEIVVCQAPCPVLTVGPSDQGERSKRFGPKNILLANDLHARSKVAELYAFSLASRWESRLTVLHVLEGRSEGVRARATQVECCGHGSSDILVLEKEVTNPAALSAETGARSDIILRVAEENSADLIVLPVFDAYRFSDRFLSTYGYQVLCGSHCPVLTVWDE